MKKIIITAIVCAFNLVAVAQQIDSVKTSSIKLRGTPIAGTEPLIVIDGNKQYIRGSSSLSGVDPNNIESINVLKDESAITKYGTDGLGGVIEIKTKNGLTGIYNTKIDSNRINLQGKATGFSIRPSVTIGKTRDLHQKGTDSKVVMRNLLQKDTDSKAKPMYVLDGKQITSIENLDPETIDAITVLKDAAGKSLYGDKAKNGVVIITTKNSKQEPQKK